jgi:hypothetical protein
MNTNANQWKTFTLGCLKLVRSRNDEGAGRMYFGALS